MATQFVFAATLLLLLFHMATFAIPSVHNINTDQSSLLAFKHHISDPSHTLSANWSSVSPVCHWVGIACGSSHHRVIGLNLSHMDLVGTIPPHLGNLSFLAELDLSNNSFYGSLPNELAQLRRLKQIVLNFNHFSGEIPSWFVLLPKLQVLSVKYNSLSGTIPVSLFDITSLRKLNLRGNKLGGILPFNVFSSSSLQYIDFGDNLISGSIPPVILNNSPLQHISLSINNLSGELSNRMFHHFSNLRELYLYDNQFSNNIPLSLFSCKQLEILALSFNRFEVSIPQAIGNLTMLKEIDLGHNNFYQGKNTIPNEIGNLHNLKVMALCDAKLNGNIPSSIFNISTLIEISLCDNQFSGSLPSSLGSRLPNLEVLLLWQNHLSGKIPNSLANATRLQWLDLSTNSFSSYIPDIFGNLRNLEVLYLGDINVTTEPSNQDMNFLNSLTNCRYLRRLLFKDISMNSILPSSIGNLSTSLEYLQFWNCKMRGSIPSNIGNLSGLIRLNLGENLLTRSIPTEIEKLQNLQGLYLPENNLEGFLPKEICQLIHLSGIFLSLNKFSGLIPTCLGNITTLREIWLDDNTFNSTISSTLWGLSDLMYLDLSSNELRGSLAPEIGNLKAVIGVHLSKNKLSGRIPSTIGGLQNLKQLYLDENKFEGPIPQSFGDMVSLESLDLSKNILSGVIPKSLEALLYLKLFNVSFNNLKGQIPIGGPFRKFSAQSFMGNKELCGAPRLQLPNCKAVAFRQSSKIIAVVLKYVLPSVVATMLLLTFIYALLKCQKTKKPSIAEADETVATWRRISYYELQRATNGFADANLHGIGSFGKVYKGILSDGFIVAVKVFNLAHEGAFKSFDVECEILCNVRHRNLTKIISSCSNIEFKALALSYMSNGSLEKWLHSHDHYLSIIQRLSIMIDVAAALDYLHHGCQMPIVHCDLKPNNVLLDEDMVAHLTDFGISKLLSGGEFITQTMTLATMGYMAPEYGLEGIVSRQGDVYSYGILLIETFTGKKPTHEMFEGELSIKQWVKESYPNVIMDVIDPKLLTEHELQFAINRDCLVSVIGLALDCTAESPSERKNIKDVLVALEKTKMRFLNVARDPRLFV